MRYRRLFSPGATYFFTLNLADRKSALLIEKINDLKAAIKMVKTSHPFQIVSFVILPDHLHIIIKLPIGDTNYPKRVNLIKGYFSKYIKRTEGISRSRREKRERGVWQRRYWEHCIRDEKDLENHINYIHYNPVKHGYVKNIFLWKYSSVHKFYQDYGLKNVELSNEVLKLQCGE